MCVCVSSKGIVPETSDLDRCMNLKVVLRQIELLVHCIYRPVYVS